MREAEFREWLEANGANSASGMATRTYAIKTIESALLGLGITYADLAEAWDANKFEDIRQVLADIRSDALNGGTRFRVLMPESESPARRLASWRSWLGQYERFLSGEGIGMADADRIRNHVLETYIETARERDEAQVEFVVKDVNDALGLNQAWPNICQALRGRKFLELADVPPAQTFGADQSTATVFRLDTDVDEYWAKKALIERYGPALAQTKKMISFALPDGRQVALDLEAARAQLWFEGEILAPADSGVETKPYVANAPRHSNLPARLSHNGDQARPVTMVVVRNLEELQQVLDQYEGGAASQHKSALLQLRDRFLKRFPDFESGGGFPGRSGYHPEEDYKHKLVARAAELRAAHADDPRTLGGALLDLLLGDTDLDSNLLGWRAANSMRQRRTANPGVLEDAIGAAVLDVDPVRALQTLVDRCWPVFVEGQKSKPYSDSRTIPTALMALVHPDEIISLRTDRFNNLFMALEGHKLFDWAPLSAEEYHRASGLAQQIFATMRDDWGWQPRNLWDVQGFIWVACVDAAKDEDEVIPVYLVTARWGDEDGLERFVERGEWSLQTDTGSSSNRLVREMQPGDCIVMRDFFTQKHDLPFDANGKTVTGHRIRAIGTVTEQRDDGLSVGVEWEVLDPPRTWYFYTHNAPVWRLQLDGSSEAAPQLAGFILEGEEQDYDWFLKHPYWHKRIFGTEAGQEEQQMRKPTNLILYGPPGTGKTYRTAWEAVRLCDGAADFPDDAEGRAALMARYGELQDEGRIRFVTFHQNFSYEEFVEGLRPETNGADEDGAGFRLEPRAGIFHEMCTVAGEGAEGETQQFVLIIDEINRANISKVFGELITLLEPDKRLGQTNALTVRLPYSKKEFGVPSNLHVIGTMNTADRSIALLDTALRRRFRFEELAPDASVLPETVGTIPLQKVLTVMNQRIEYLIDREHRIGHALFMGEDPITESSVDAAMRDKVIPLLAEYFFEDWSCIASVVGDGFLAKTVLQPPPGVEGDARDSWSVRPTFLSDAYVRLIKGSMPSDEATAPPAQEDDSEA